MTLLDAQGKVVQAPQEALAMCPNCGSGRKHHELYNAFGGHWKKACNLCGHIFGHGQGTVPEGMK